MASASEFPGSVVRSSQLSFEVICMSGTLLNATPNNRDTNRIENTISEYYLAPGARSKLVNG